MISIINQEGLEILVINSKVETKINLPTQVNLEIIRMVTNLETITVTSEDSLVLNRLALEEIKIS